MLKQILEAGARFGRKSLLSDEMSANARQKLDELRARGFVMFDHLVGSPHFAAIQADLRHRIENDMTFEFPCLAQSRIDARAHADLIANSFRVQPDELAIRGLTFDRADIRDYREVVDSLQPSTLKLLMPDNRAYFSIWLDPTMLSVVEAYMGFKPILREAYIRRNFPCTYRVMNHNWHRDTNHKHHLLKAFIFFNDCFVDTGAHRYIAGSMKNSNFRDKVYYSDAEVEAVYPEQSKDHIISEVPAGTIILEDTRGLHKAGIPKRHYRDLGFAVFVPPMLFRNESKNYVISEKVFTAMSSYQQSFISRTNIVR